MAEEPTVDLTSIASAGVPPAGLSIRLVDGWSHTERSGTWATGRRASLDISLLDTSPHTLVLDCLPLAAAERRQVMTVIVNGRAAGTLELKRGWREHRIELPAHGLQLGHNMLQLGFAYALSPRELGRGDDDRTLAAKFRRISLTHGAPHAASPIASGDAVQLPGAGLLVTPLRLTEGVNRVKIEVRASSPLAKMSLAVLDLDGGERVLAEGGVDWDGRVRLAGEVLATATDELVFLLLRVRTEGEGKVDLECAEVLGKPIAKDERVSQPLPGGRPDIVVVIPDALRPDHLGLSGYPRETSPNLDRLAEEALIATNAVTAASYSLASVGTIITGLSPLRHGVLEREHRLPGAVMTLAERLQGVGYATLAVSANAYHSPQFGFDQGYDRFIEMWRVTGGDQQRSFDPDLAVAEFERELRAGFADDRPLFALLHLVPPHSPYDPPPEFDLFSSPGYRGPIGRGSDTYVRLSSGELRPDPGDVTQLIGLYDGNIRRADAAIGGLLELLESRGRWRDTVVLVIADHGEAFGEHGAFGHTSTVYEEMVRVPFILRVPSDRRPDDGDLGDLVSLEDVTPTLLGLAGVPSPEQLDGIDLLRRPRDVRVTDRCVLITSGGSSRPSYGVRSTRWKAVVHELHRRELYDLQSDPAEKVDVAADHPELMVGLAQMLAEDLRQPRAADAAAPLGSEDEAALRALGYVTD